MLFKLELAEKILRKEKTMTCRLKKPGDIAHRDPETNQIPHVTDANGRIRWRVGSTYAIQPGRGKHQIGRFRLLKIKSVDVRRFRHEDVRAEGFQSREKFLRVWCGFHDRPAIREIAIFAYTSLTYRPKALYDAWALEFELVEGENHVR